MFAPHLGRDSQGEKRDFGSGAYQLTSKSIAWALEEAHLRGVSVMILADKSQERCRYSQISFLF